MDRYGRQNKFAVTGKANEKNHGNNQPAPTVGCQAMCAEYNANGQGCHSNTFAGFGSCDCDCCLNFVTYTSSGYGGDGFGGVDESSATTVCNCAQCNIDYNACIDQCIANQDMAGSHQMWSPEKGFGRRGGKIRRRGR